MTEDIRALVSELSSGPLLSTHRRKIEACMRYFAAHDFSLATVGDSRHLNRERTILQKYAREFGLKYSDYVPMALRPPKPEMVKKVRAKKVSA